MFKLFEARQERALTQNEIKIRKANGKRKREKAFSQYIC